MNIILLIAILGFAMIFLCILAHSDKKYKIITWTTGILLFTSIVFSILICCFGEVKTSYTRCELENVSVNSEMVRDGEYITIRADKYKLVKSSDHISRIGLEKITGPAPSFLRQNLAHHVKVNKENDDIFLDRTCNYKKLGVFYIKTNIFANYYEDAEYTLYVPENEREKILEAYSYY